MPRSNPPRLANIVYFVRIQYGEGCLSVPIGVYSWPRVFVKLKRKSTVGRKSNVGSNVSSKPFGTHKSEIDKVMQTNRVLSSD